MTNLQQPLAKQRFVARRYSSLQGLRGVFSGIFYLGLGAALSLGNASHSDLAFGSAMGLILVLTAVAVAGDFWIKRWYEKRFGKRSAKSADFAYDIAVGVVVFILAIAGFVVVAVTFLTMPVGFVFVGLLSLAAAAFGRRRFGGWQVYPLVYAVAMALMALLIWIIEPHGSAVTMLIYGMIGVAMIVGGLIDHFRLVHALTPAAAAEITEASPGEE